MEGESMIALLFRLLVVLSCGTAATLGGKDGRWIALSYIVAVVATHFAAPPGTSWDTAQTLVFAVDFALLAALFMIALNSDRYWPIWIAGFHLLTVASHVAAMVAQDFHYRIYFLMASVWSLPKLLVLLIGVLLDWEAGRERDRGPRRLRQRQ
jgi:hypothetical protein